MDELVKEFLAESEEGLDRMERCLTEMQRQPGSAALLGEAFRALHTLKGGTGFLGFRRLEGLAHAGEGLLHALCHGGLAATPERLSGLLHLTDAVRGVLLLIERTGGEGHRESDHAGDRVLVAMISALGRGVEEGEKGSDGDRSGGDGARAAGVGVRDRELVEAGSLAGMDLVGVRVEAQILTRLSELVEELAWTQQVQGPGGAETGGWGGSLRTWRLGRITEELRETVERARTHPAEVLFRRFPRIVRDTARECGRRVQLEIVGAETALDKSVLHVLKDPLMHALRNAIDHGIEAPLDRTRAGKPVEGRVRVEAKRVGEMVEVEVSDDGAGVSRDAVMRRAVALGMVEESRALTMTDQEVLWLVFRQGFSTATEVTHISGRGVGMDVVWANVVGVGGTVELLSEVGVGTRLRLRIPRTISMVPALLVRCGGEVMGVPRRSVVEVVWPEASEGMGLGTDGRGAVVMVEVEGIRYGIGCEEVLGWRELAVRPMGEAGGAGEFAGEAVLEDLGRVPVMDVRGLGESDGRRTATKPRVMCGEDEGFARGEEFGGAHDVVTGRGPAGRGER